jgi:aerobic carbon-monoxide dehydrogenase medium subunit
MKPAPFDYLAPRTLDDALAALAADAEGEAKILAGGQSLVPLLNFRLATPRRLIDLNRVPGLSYIREQDGGFAIGAMTRQHTLEHDAHLAGGVPLLSEALPFVGHPAIRSRGTLGGSLAHADPAAELPAVAACLDARLTLVGPRGKRTLPAHEFFVDYLTTRLEPDEILTEAWFPKMATATGQAWLEFSRRHGDFALAGVGVSLSLEDDRVTDARIALTGVGATPVRAREAEKVLVGGSLAERLGAAVEAVRAGLDPPTDIHASSDYRVHLAGVLTERALRLAAERARSNTAAALDVGRMLDQAARRA